jgi:hypothetical protein
MHTYAYFMKLRTIKVYKLKTITRHMKKELDCSTNRI